ncbi:hypothetical protein DFH08DRAFT_803951 [Mycena albidolilacea]|uniref:Uncharacterized protein n=1 Tax=Mycena albidolilacea TaxID=1033008 RepID=A0AAD7ABV4_9AGAR|nr:hypothetical protein DFH08DRAFT_803951 [Mycena albidolilacea]
MAEFKPEGDHMREEAKPETLKWFSRDVPRYMAQNATEESPLQNKMRHDAKITDIETYKHQRRLNVWFDAALAFSGSEMEELNAPGIELAWLINDILSWNKEQRTGDMCNLISLILIHEQKSIQDAMDDAEQELRSQVLKWCSAKTRGLQAYRDHKDIEDLKT